MPKDVWRGVLLAWRGAIGGMESAGFSCGVLEGFVEAPDLMWWIIPHFILGSEKER